MADYSFDPTAHSTDVVMREALGHQIATAIARDILTGRLVADSALSQEALCARFGTSRMPARDAIRELSASGYVVAGRGNQVRVAPMAAEDVEDMLEVELSVSTLMARRAAERATDTEIATLHRLHQHMLSAAEREDADSMSELNRQFHLGLYDAARSSRLMAAFRAITLHVGWRFYSEHPERMSIANVEHERVLAAVSARDAAAAAAAMREHVADAQFSTMPVRPAANPSGHA